MRANEKDFLSSAAAVEAFEKALKEGFVTTRRTSKADPKPLAEVVQKDGIQHGRANIILDGESHPVSFFRQVSKNPKEPYLRIDFTDQSGRRTVRMQASTLEFVLDAEIIEPDEPAPVANLPKGMLKAPGADMTLVNAEDLMGIKKGGQGLARTQTFTLVRTGLREETLLYRPVKDDALITDSDKAKRIETIPEIPLNDLPHLSGKTVAKIAKDLDPFIPADSLEFYKPVEVKPTHPLSREVAAIILNHLYPRSDKG